MNNRRTIARRLAGALLVAVVAWCAGATPSLAQQRHVYVEIIEELYYSNDFERLEEIAEVELSKRRRTSDGLWYISLFHSAFEFPSTAQEPVHLRLIETAGNWIQRFPNSPVAHVILAQALRQYGVYRHSLGGEIKPTQHGHGVLHQYLAESRRILDQAKEVSRPNPVWYTALLKNARYEGWNDAKVFAVLQEAMEKDAGYYETYFRGALLLLLADGQEMIANVERFVAAAVKATHASEGESLYARIYWALANFTSVEVLGALDVDWAKMKASFEDIVRRYPTEWNYNAYASFACLHDDVDAMRSALQRADGYDPRAWIVPYAFDECLQRGRLGRFAVAR